MYAKISSEDALLTTQNVLPWSGRFGGGHTGWSQQQLASSVSPLWRWHLQNPLSCSGDQKSYPNAIWASVEDDHTRGRPCSYPNHEENQVSLIVENQGRADQANWTLCFCPHGLKTFGSSWVSLKTTSQMPQTDSWSSPPTPHFGHAGTRIRTISSDLMWYLIMNPGTTFTAVMVVPEFVGVLVRD